MAISEMHKLYLEEGRLLYELNHKLGEILKPKYVPAPDIASGYKVSATLRIMNERLDNISSMETLFRRNNALEGEIISLRNKNCELERKISNLENVNSTLRKGYDDLEAKLKKTKKTLKKRKGKYRDEITTEEILVWRNAGLSIQKIADKYHTSRQTIYNRLKEKD